MNYIKLPSTLNHITMGAFSNIINGSVTNYTVECAAFDPSKIQLESLVFESSRIFFNVTNSTLIVPPGTKELYQAAAQWKNFGTIREKNYTTNLVGNEWVDVYDLAYFKYNYYLGNRSAIFDFNNDNYVNNTDMSMLVNDIFGCVYPAVNESSYASDVISIENYSINLSSACKLFEMRLSPTNKLSAIQFDVKIPEELSNFYIRSKDTDKYYVETKMISHNVYRVICTMTKELLNGYTTITTPVIPLYFRFSIYDNPDEPFEFSNIILANENAEYFQRPFSYLTTIKGDVNGDGSCTSSDVTALYNLILYNDNSAIVNGDQNGDGAITSSDVTAVYNIILGF